MSGKKSLILAFFLFLLTVSSVMAQVFDVRAFSRQRGFRAYQSGQSPIQNIQRPIERPQQETITEPASEKEENSAKTVRQPAKKEEKQSDQTDEFLKYIKQNPQVNPDI